MRGAPYVPYAPYVPLLLVYTNLGMISKRYFTLDARNEHLITDQRVDQIGAHDSAAVSGNGITNRRVLDDGSGAK